MPKKPLAVLAGDTHVARGAWSSRPQIAGDSYRALKTIRDLCFDLECSLVLAGDVCDSPYPTALDLQHLMLLNDVNDIPGCRLHHVRGQHDMNEVAGDPPYLQVVCPDSTWLNALAEPVPIKGKDGPTVFGRDFMHAAALKDFLKNSPQCDLLVLHQLWREWMGDRGGQASLDEVGRCNVLLTGDFHQSVSTKSSRGFHILSPGPTQAQNIREVPNYWCYVLYEDLSVEAVPLPARPYRELNVSNEDDVKAFCAEPERWLEVIGKPSPKGQGPLLRVNLLNPVAGAAARIEQAFAGLAHVFISGKDDGGILPDVYVPFAADRGDIVAEAAEVLQANFAPGDPLLPEALELAQASADPAGAVRQLRARYLPAPTPTPTQGAPA